MKPDSCLVRKFFLSGSSHSLGRAPIDGSRKNQRNMEPIKREGITSTVLQRTPSEEQHTQHTSSLPFCVIVLWRLPCPTEKENTLCFWSKEKSGKSCWEKRCGTLNWITLQWIRFQGPFTFYSKLKPYPTTVREMEAVYVARLVALLAKAVIH